MTSKPCIVIGSGGHAKVVIDALRLMGRTILFATTNEASDTGKEVLGVDVKGDDSLIDAYGPDDIDLALGVGAPRLGDLRKKIWAPFEKKGFRQITVVHPSAVVAADSVLEDGAQIMAGTSIQPGSVVGTGAIINTGASIDHDCRIGAFAHIGPGVTLCGNVKIGDNCLIGAGSTLTPGIAIKENSFVAAGTTINKQADE